MAVPDFLRFMAPEMVPSGMPSCGLLRSRFFAASTNVRDVLRSRCGPVVVSLWSRRFITIYHSNLLMWSRCGLAFHGFHQCQ